MAKNPIRTFTDTVTGKTTKDRVEQAETGARRKPEYTDNRPRKMSPKQPSTPRSQMTKEQRLKADVKKTFGY